MLNFLMLMNLEYSGIFLLMIYLRQLNFVDEEFNSCMKFSLINFWMVLLVFVLYLMMMWVDFLMKFSLNFLLIVLVFLMSVNSLLIFFLLYEMIFILIMFTILWLGYSYERLLAGFLMMFYSFLFSSPILMMILLFDHVFLMKMWLFYSNIIIYFFIGSFMVKFPIFGFHYWLPIAHVEASTIGSMLLAGILLKMGSLGLWYSVSYFRFLVKFHWLVLGVLLMMISILSLSDLKMMIAYSSIAHMSLVFYVMNLGWEIGMKGAIMMMFYHGFISPIMFWLVGMLSWWKTRSLMVVKLLMFSYVFVLLVFFLVILNMGFPPFLGFMSEVMMLKSFVLNSWVLYVIIVSVLWSCYYNVYLFWCFNGIFGLVFKSSISNFDLFGFLILSLILNFF